MELDYRAIGKRIKIARIKADLTQEALAEKASLSTTHMSNIETGNSKLSLPTIVSLANALSVSVDEFLWRDTLQRYFFAGDTRPCFRLRRIRNPYDCRLCKGSKGNHAQKCQTERVIRIKQWRGANNRQPRPVLFCFFVEH